MFLQKTVLVIAGLVGQGLIKGGVEHQLQDAFDFQIAFFCGGPGIGKGRINHVDAAVQDGQGDYPQQDMLELFAHTGEGQI